MTRTKTPQPETLITRARRLLKARGSKIAACIFCIALLVLSGYVVKSFFDRSAPDAAYYTTYIDTETGKVFRHKNEIGETLPILSPDTGKNTGMPAEACYWTADGKTKTDPTWVLLNEELGKKSPTFCPDCGRLVVGHNPPPHPGMKPPPTQTEYAARKMGQRPTARLSN